MLYGYFDETNIHDGAFAAGMYGLIGTEASWNALEPKWASRRDQDRIKTFHATDCQTYRCEYADRSFWNRARVDSHLTDLAGLIGETELALIGSAVVLDAWDKIITGPARVLLSSPYHFCMTVCIQVAVAWSKEKANSEPITLIFANQDKYADYSGVIMETYHKYKEMRDVLSSIAFSTPEKLIQLQAADLVANQLAYRFSHQEEEVQPPLKKMSAVWDRGKTAWHGHKELIQTLASTPSETLPSPAFRTYVNRTKERAYQKVNSRRRAQRILSLKEGLASPPRLEPKSNVEAMFHYQMELLSVACETYDQGNEFASERIATCLFKLLHDRRKGAKALLTQMGIRNTMRYVATGEVPSPYNLAPQTPLIHLDPHNFRQLPVLDKTDKLYLSYGAEKRRLISFSDWWENQEVIRVCNSPTEANAINRKELLFGLKIIDTNSLRAIKNPAFLSLATTPTWIRNAFGTEVHIRGILTATARQIAWEFQETMRRNGLFTET